MAEPWIHRTKPDRCPDCGKTIDAAGNASLDETGPPSPGDWSLCFACSAVLVFDENLRVRRPTLAEQAELPEDVLDHLNRLSMFRGRR